MKKVLAAISILIVLSSCASPGNLIKNINPIKVEKNVLTNLPGTNGPLLAVKIDDTNAAHPQVGLNSADVIYIEQVEGGLTRLAAIFSSQIPTHIGPVRSARISDIELLEQYGRVAFAYSGAQKKMRPVIDAANLEDLGAQNHSSTIYTTDPNRIQPYAMVLRADLLMQYVKDKEIAIESSQSMGWSFGDAPSGGVAIESAHLSWPASSYDAHWSETEKRWLLDHSYAPDIADSAFLACPDISSTRACR